MSGAQFRAVHQLVPRLSYGDAIGNQVRALRRLFQAWGYASQIFADAWDERLAGECQPSSRYARVSQAKNLLLLHYGAGVSSQLSALTWPDKVVLYYHNLTPAHYYYRTTGAFAAQLVEARRNLARLAGRVPAVAGSPYNRQELEAMGFRVVAEVPYFLALAELDEGLRTPAAAALLKQYQAPGTRTWLHVGRLAPNKRLEDIVNAFYYYHRFIYPHSRLLLVGSTTGNERYVEALRRQIEQLELQAAVILTGAYGPAEGLGVFYTLADVYVCLSEHEGFCLPLVEAMHYNVPVLAYAAAGIPFTLGQAGVQFTQKNYPVIAEMVDEVIVNEPFRRQLIAGQRARLAEFTPERCRTQVRAALEALATL